MDVETEKALKFKKKPNYQQSFVPSAAAVVTIAS